MKINDASAWGRRIFNEDEIDAVDEEDFLVRFTEIAETEAEKSYISCTDRDRLLKLGLWDMVYNSGKYSSPLVSVKKI